MHIAVYYTANYEYPNAIETTTTPLESGWDTWRVAFGQDKESDCWGIYLYKHVKKSKTNTWVWEHRGYCVSTPETTAEGLADWLEENVAMVEVDGRPFWTNPRLGDE